MKKLLYIATCVLLGLTGCQKELESPEATETAFSIEANLNPFEDESELDTKAGADAVVRLNWTAGDKISVINMTTGKALGGDLVAQQSGSTSTFSGSLSGTLRSGDKLAFLYPSQNYTAEQAFTGATIDLSSQAGSSRIPLAVSAVMTYNGSSTQNLYLDFDYLMSYYQLNLAELPMSSTLSNVRFYGMGAKTTMRINGTGTGLTSTPEDGMIKVESSSLTSSDKGTKAVYIAGFASPSQAAREVRVKTATRSYKTTWTSAALSAGKFYTSIISKFQQFDEPAEVNPGGGSDTHYVDEYGVDRGAGFEITETVAGENRTVVWAPVNLGYSESYPYGKLYQWGRKAGQGYGAANANDEAGNMVAVETSPAESGMPFMSPDAGTFYTYINSSTFDWYAATTADQLSGDWNDIEETEYVGNPCPEGWRVPTLNELFGLYANKSSWTSKDGQYGCYFKGSSASLPDASSLFLPAAGCRYYFNGGCYDRGDNGYYWSSSPGGSLAYFLHFASSDVDMESSSRAFGCSVRCVQDANSTPSTGVTKTVPAVSKPAAVGEPGMTIAVISAEVTKAGGQKILERGMIWGTSSSITLSSCVGSAKADIADAGRYTCTALGLSAGTSYYFRAYAKNASGTAYSDPITVRTKAASKSLAYVDENGTNRGNGIEIIENVDGVTKPVVWAPVNLGYSSSYPYGKLYQWGRKTGQGYGSVNANDEAGSRVTVTKSTATEGSPLTNPLHGTFYTYVNSSPYDWYAATTAEQFKADWNDIEETEYVGNPCPEGWRVPTRYELAGLVNKSSWTTKDSQNGYYFRGSVSSLPDASSLFLPAAGYRSDSDGDSYFRGSSGCYRSSTLDGSSAYFLNFYSSYVSIDGNGRAIGYSVRCVQE